MNVPIPSIFLNEDGTYAVIDGKQRLFAIQEFLRGRVAIAASVSARRGFTAVPLAQAVPRAAGWRLSSLPRALETEQVARLLESCDRTTAIERRDHPPMAAGGPARTVTLTRPEEPRCPATTS